MNTLINGGSDAPESGGDALVTETTTQTFAADVLEASQKQPVLVDFWAPWCGPCRTLGPIIEKAVKDARGAVKLVKMNIDEHPAIAGQLGIQSIPAVIAFANGQPVDGFVGALPEGQIKEFIAKIAGPQGPTPEDELIAEGQALLDAGDIQDAAERFGAALRSDPESIDAVVGLAECLLATGEVERASQTLDMVPEKAANDPRVAAVRAKLDIASQTADLGDSAPLQNEIAANPNNFQARFDLALLLNDRGDREGAADQLLEILTRNRSWEEEKARKQLLQFFDAWGPMDEATLSGRRRLSSILFA